MMRNTDGVDRNSNTERLYIKTVLFDFGMSYHSIEVLVGQRRRSCRENNDLGGISCGFVLPIFLRSVPLSKSSNPHLT